MNIAVYFFITLLNGSFTHGAELTAFTRVDLNRYVGKWHEIARLPMKHQEGCVKSQAEYALEKDGTISVTNSCTLNNGDSKVAKGIARVQDKQSNAKLKVNFVPAWLRWLGIGWGDYWIIDLDPDYNYAVVSEPSRTYLWILSRSPNMKKSLYDGIIARLKEKDFDLSKLIVSGEIK